MAHAKQVRSAVRRDYITQGIRPEVLGPMHGVSIVTVNRWRKEARDSGDDWDKHRAALRLSGNTCEEMSRSLLLEFLEHQEYAMGKLRETREAMTSDGGMSATEYSKLLVSLQDGFNKMMAASRRILPETDRLIVAGSVMEDFAAFLMSKHPALMTHFLDVLPASQEIVEKKYG